MSLNPDDNQASQNESASQMSGSTSAASNQETTVHSDEGEQPVEVQIFTPRHGSTAPNKTQPETVSAYSAPDENPTLDSLDNNQAWQPDADLSPSIEIAGKTDSEPSGWEVTKAVIREIVETVVLTLIIFFLIQLVIRNFRVDGHSMDPNLHHGQYLVVDKFSYNLPFDWRSPQRGDVVVFEPPTHPDKDFVKRIIALPGETVEIRRGQVYINSTMLEEPFGARIDQFSMPPQEVSPDTYFVMGDNRPNSNDSRNWGALETDRIVGKAWLSYWPPETWGVIPNDGPTDSATFFNWLRQITQ